MIAPTPAASVILSTYRQPQWLRMVLWGYSVQTVRNFEIVVADDGSGPRTAAVVEKASRELAIPVRHVWHEDIGYRKCTILNRAVVEARSDYLIFTDGDCIPRNDFVASHLRLRRPRRFLSGGALRLPLNVSRALGREDVQSGRFAHIDSLARAGWRPGYRRLRLLRSRFLAALLDFVTPTSATWNGGNSSVAREAVLRVNGFENSLGAGGQDREFGARLENAGVQGKQARHRAVLIHLHHARPYRTTESEVGNRRAREEVERSGRFTARNGIAELEERDEGKPRHRPAQTAR